MILLLAVLLQGGEPSPGVGIFFKPGEVAALRGKVRKPPCKPIFERLRKDADAAIAKWADDKAMLRIDYTLGEILSSGRTVGYGQGKESLLSNRDSFPLYVKPTYWLLPEEKPGWIEVTLAKTATVDLVRLLNTSNAGLNDFAAHEFHVEPYDSSHALLATKEGRFGKVFDRPFKQAFFVPEWYSHYPESFAGMLEPGLTVPFGDGWKAVHFGDVKGVMSVRIAITKYWGIGGGLNEVQIYGKE